VAVVQGGLEWRLGQLSLGLSPLLVQEIGKIILDINRGGTSVLLVE